MQKNSRMAEVQFDEVDAGVDRPDARLGRIRDAWRRLSMQALAWRLVGNVGIAQRDDDETRWLCQAGIAAASYSSVLGADRHRQSLPGN
jgi:hypothetical protein